MKPENGILENSEKWKVYKECSFKINEIETETK